MRHRTDEAGDGDQRCRFAFSPADMISGDHTDEQRILAAVANVENFGHG
jgi:hypothetical protein